MKYTPRQIQREMERIERELDPVHLHNPMIEVGPDDDTDELLAAAQSECRRYGCAYGHIIVPKWIPLDEATPGTWKEMVRQQLEAVSDLDGPRLPYDYCEGKDDHGTT